MLERSEAPMHFAGAMARPGLGKAQIFITCSSLFLCLSFVSSAFPLCPPWLSLPFWLTVL